MEPITTFVGFLALCAVSKSVAKLADKIVGTYEEKKRIDAQVGRLKKWKHTSVVRQTSVTSSANKKDMELVGSADLELTDELTDDEYMGRMISSRSAYVAQQKAQQDGHAFDADCDKCHVCGSPDPESKAAQHRMRNKMGVDGLTNTIMKAYVGSVKKGHL